MVTSNKLPDRKVVKMAEQNNSVMVPQRTLLGDINVHITCPICRGYYIDATTIVECLHSFCRSCIIKHLQVNRNNSYCPVCEMMINPAKPNIKLDKALQDIVYKLVPGLFQKEMERRQKFYASRPGPAASATPEQRGEDTERIIFSPEDVISFSLEYADATDTDSISSKSSDSNEAQIASAIAKRYLQCPAVVNISHLKKFLCMKFDIDSTQFAIDILYKRVPLPDYYSLMDIAYIYNWKRNEPMRFFYQIIDYVAIRNRLFDINTKSTHFRDQKQKAPFDDGNSSAQNLNDQGSEASSGTDSPMPNDNSKLNNNLSRTVKSDLESKSTNEEEVTASMQPPLSGKKNEEVEKSEFLNSFELTAKNTSPTKSSPLKQENVPIGNDSTNKSQTTSKTEDSLKRKNQAPSNIPEMKKLKIELEKAKLPQSISSPVPSSISTNTKTSSPRKNSDTSGKPKDIDTSKHSLTAPTNTTSKVSIPTATKSQEMKTQGTPGKQTATSEFPGPKVSVALPLSVPPKLKPLSTPLSVSSMQSSTTQKTVSPLKLQLPKLSETIHSSLNSSPSTIPSSDPKPTEISKPAAKKIPDLKPGVPSPLPSQNKVPQVNKVRMDFLANNCDPTMDRSKILSQVKVHSPGQPTGDPLKSLFDSCKINIPSSLSITLTDQKLDPRNIGETSGTDPKKYIVNKNLAGANNGSALKVPSPPVHNYIEILKLPDTDPKKQTKSESQMDSKSPQSVRADSLPIQPKPPSKSSESSAKGPIPNLKPIADAKLGKVSGNFTPTSTSSSSPITFQQTFEQQFLQSDKKPKLPKSKGQVPKLVPANPKTFNISTVNKIGSPSGKHSPNAPSPMLSTPESKPSTALDLSTPQPKLPKPVGQVPKLVPAIPKAFSTVSKAGSSGSKPNQSSTLTPENKPSTALDLSTPHNLPTPSQLSLSKAFETMQTIANLAKNLPSKSMPSPISQSFPSRSLSAGILPMRLPNIASLSNNQSTLRQDMGNKTPPNKQFRIPGPMGWPH